MNNQPINSFKYGIMNNGSITIKGDGLIHQQYEITTGYKGVLFGPEVELFVVDKGTLKPKNCLDHLAGHPLFGTYLKPELAAEQIEISTPPGSSLLEVHSNLLAIAADVLTTLDRCNAVALPIPLMDTAEFTITDHPRYRLLIDTLGESFRKHAVMVASDQINIGAENEEQAFKIFNTVRNFLPEFIGFSAASPFKDGKVTDRDSNRLDAYDAAIAKYPYLTGVPPELHCLWRLCKRSRAAPCVPASKHVLQVCTAHAA